MSFQEIEAIIFDLDGTAVPGRRDGMPSPALIEAVRSAKTKLKIATASGRSERMCLDIWDALDIESPCAVSGGTKVVDPITGEVLWEKHVPDQAFPSIIDACRGVSMVRFYLGSQVVNHVDELIGPFRSHVVIASGMAEQESINLATQLSIIPDLIVQRLPSWTEQPIDVHVTGATKRHGVEVLIQLLGTTKGRTAGVGNGINDLELFEAVGLRIAMGDGDQSLKDKAHLITDTFENDGLAKIINKITASK